MRTTSTPRREPSSSRALVIIACAVAATAPSMPGAARADASVRVDGVAALVGGVAPGSSVIVLLQSDVELRALLESARRSEADASRGTAPLPVDLARTLETMVGEALILREAERRAATSVDEGALEAEWQQLFAEMGGAERLDALRRSVDATEAEIAELVRKRAVVRAFVESNLAGADTVTEATVERAFEEGRHPFVGADLETVRVPLRAWLARRAVQEAMIRWIELLRARTFVRVSPSFAGRLRAGSS